MRLTSFRLPGSPGKIRKHPLPGCGGSCIVESLPPRRDAHFGRRRSWRGLRVLHTAAGGAFLFLVPLHGAAGNFVLASANTIFWMFFGVPPARARHRSTRPVATQGGGSRARARRLVSACSCAGYYLAPAAIHPV